jgi:hypothetical protein
MAWCGGPWITRPMRAPHLVLASGGASTTGRPTRAKQESGQETQLLGALPSVRKISMLVLLGTPRRHPRSRRGTSVAQSPHVLLRLSRRPIRRRLKDEFHELLLADHAFLAVTDSLYPILPDIGHRRKCT